jgi:heat shock protein HslJ
VSPRRTGWLLALGVAACGPQADPVAVDPPAAKAAAIVGTEWELARIGAAAPATGTRVTLQFDADRLGGYGGCNWYGATWSSRDGAMRIGQVESTARGCAGPVLAQEATLFATLQRVGVEWTPRAVAAMDPADLAGTRWRWQAPGAAQVRLEFVDGRRLRGFAGCRDFHGTWRGRGDRLAVDTLAMAQTDCARGEAAQALEGRFIDAFDAIETWRLDGDRLTLRNADGAAVEFVRER